jgi:hypothetical protein
MTQKALVHDGHLIDSGILTNILNLIIEEGGDYEISRFNVGKTPDDESHLRILLKASDSESLEALSDKLSVLGMRGLGETEAVWGKVIRDKAAPENFYSTTNHRTEVYYDGKWRQVSLQRMDAAIVKRRSGPECVKLRDLKVDDDVLLGSSSVTVHPRWPRSAVRTVSLLWTTRSPRNATPLLPPKRWHRRCAIFVNAAVKS